VSTDAHTSGSHLCTKMGQGGKGRRHNATCRPIACSPVCTADTIMMRSAASAVASDAAKSDSLQSSEGRGG